MSTVTVYTLSNCDTCRRAVKWLQAAKVAFTEKAIRETPPSAAELRAVLKIQQGELRRLFNTSGREYRALGLGEKLPAMSEEQSIALLASNGSLVKRPLLVGAGVGLVGFDEVTWGRALAKK
jgi:arsenate reductase